MPPFTIAQVIRISFSVIGRNLVVLLGLSVALGLVANQIHRVVLSGVENAVLFAVGEMVIYAATSALFASSVVFTVASDARGSKGKLAPMLRCAVEAFGPVFVLSFLLNGLSALPWLITLVLFLALHVVFWTALPALVLERKGLVSALQLGSRHSRGKRWQVAGLALVASAFFAVVLIGLWSLAPYGSMSDEHQAFWDIFVFAPIDVFFVVAMAVSYFLMNDSDPNEETVLSVFD